MIKLLDFLKGKKTTIWAILALAITLCLKKGYIDADVAVFFNGVLLALWLTANITSSIVTGKK